MGNPIYKRADKTEFFSSNDFVKNLIWDRIKSFGFKKILDPCCGDGALDDFDSGCEFVLFDIVDRNVGAIITDFLEVEQKEEYKSDCAIINPPFSKLKEFVEKARLFTNKIYLIAPIKTTLKLYKEYVTYHYFDWQIPHKIFGVLTSIGIFELDFSKPPKSLSIDFFLGKKITDTFENHIKIVDKAPNKPFIVNRITKARAVRGETLIKEIDCRKANDNSIFIAEKTNTNIKKGQTIKRGILEFETEEEMMEFVKKYNSNSDTIREYIYLHGNNVLKLNKIPWLN